MGKLIDKFKEYLLKHNLDFYCNDYSINLFDKELDKKITIPYNISEKHGAGFKEFIEDNNYEALENEEFIENFLTSALSENNRSKIYKNKISQYKDRSNAGVYLDGFSEFLITIKPQGMGRYNYYDFDRRLGFGFNFKIGDILVSISKPSNMFRFIFKSLKVIESWDSCYTISLNGIAKDNVNEYLQEALFFINATVKFIDLGFNEKEKVEYNINLTKNSRIIKLPKANYNEPICFYNYSENLLGEPYFHYNYKVLEYFFFINQGNKIQSLYQQCNTVELLKGLNKICNTKETASLNLLLNNDQMKNHIQYILSYNIEKLPYALEEGEKCGSIDINKFSKYLYEYRNSIIHGKGDFNFDLKVPSLIEDTLPSIKWNSLVEALALYYIGYFCYNQDWTANSILSKYGYVDLEDIDKNAN